MIETVSAPNGKVISSLVSLEGWLGDDSNQAFVAGLRSRNKQRPFEEKQPNCF